MFPGAPKVLFLMMIGPRGRTQEELYGAERALWGGKSSFRPIDIFLGAPHGTDYHEK